MLSVALMSYECDVHHSPCHDVPGAARWEGRSNGEAILCAFPISQFGFFRAVREGRYESVFNFGDLSVIYCRMEQRRTKVAGRWWTYILILLNK
jgi:hypothetical protein